MKGLTQDTIKNERYLYCDNFINDMTKTTSLFTIIKKWVRK